MNYMYIFIYQLYVSLYLSIVHKKSKVSCLFAGFDVYRHCFILNETEGCTIDKAFFLQDLYEQKEADIDQVKKSYFMWVSIYDFISIDCDSH